MKGTKGLILLTSFFFLIPFISFGQYILNGSAEKESCNCYVLSTENKSLIGSVWQATKIDLTKPFDYFFDVYLGCIDLLGADGIVFILQPNSTSIGAFGEGLGFRGITPSVGIPLDTHKNSDDPTFDHISIQLNGDIRHQNDLAGPVTASASSDNIEDCRWHKLRIVWNPATDSLSAYFDGVWRLGSKIDLIKDVFNNDPMVYWGFSGSTGGYYNIQKFCTSLDPEFETQLPKNTLCLGNPVEFKNNSVGSIGISNYSWDFGDGNLSTSANPVHTYTNPGKYIVTHHFTSNDGCESKSLTRDIIIGDIPNADLEVYDTCENISARITTVSSSAFGSLSQWEWTVNNQLISRAEHPDLSKLAAGNYTLSLAAITEYGCKSAVVSNDFIVKPKPVFNFAVKDGCIDEVIQFSGTQSTSQPITSWQWQFGDGIFRDGRETEYTFTTKGSFPVALNALGENGCRSNLIQTIFINSAIANAGKDTLVLPGDPFQLKADGGINYTWTPARGLNNPAIANPVGNIEDDMRYVVKVATAEGCTDTASVLVSVFKGSAVFVPNAFTPNNDGLNDILKPYLIGIKSLLYFTVYDRWGKKLFTTNSLTEGWDGRSAGKTANPGTYVWVLKAEDFIGKKYSLNGEVLIIN